MSNEMEGRTMVDHTDSKFEGRFVPLYKALFAEHGNTTKSRKEAVAKEENPNSWVRPQQYALAVPDGEDARFKMVGELMQMFRASFRARSGFMDGQKPAEGRPSENTVYEEDLGVLCEALVDIMPVPDSPDFADFLRMRTDVSVSLVKGGLVEAMAVLQRFQLKFQNTNETIKAAQGLAKDVPGAKGFVKVSNLDTGSRAKLIGGRIIRLDDRILVPGIVENNRGLFEELGSVFEDTGTEFQAVVTAFNEKIDTFATKLQPRDPQFIRVQWFNSLLSNLRTQLDCDDAEVGSKLMQIAEGLKTAKDAQAFKQVINSIGTQVQ